MEAVKLVDLGEKLVDLGDAVKETQNAVPGGPPDELNSDLRPDPYPFK
jgi:hypothetical protein